MVETLLVEPADDASLDHRRRRSGAEAQTVDRLERNAAIRRGRTHGDAKPRLGMLCQAVAPCRLARLSAAKLEDAASCRLAAKIMVEGNDAVHLGAGQVERVRHHRDRCFRHAAKRFLQSLQDGQQRAVPIAMLQNDLVGAICTPRFVFGHLVRSFSIRTSAETGEIAAVNQWDRSNDAIGEAD